MRASAEQAAPAVTPGLVLSRQLEVQHERVHSERADIEVQDHQREALDSIDAYLANGGTSGYVEMATASGKSYLIALLAQAAADIGMRTVILAPSVQNCHQLNGEDGQKGLGKFTDLQQTGRVGARYGDTLSKARLAQPVVITTYQSLNNLVERGEIANVDLVLADEAHRSLGEVTSKTLLGFSPNAIKLGFTATPGYSPDKSVDQIFGDKVHGFDLRESVERGRTPPIRSLIYETNVDIPVLDPGRSDFTERELARLISLRGRNQAIVEFAKNFVQSGLQGAIACVPGSNLAHARLIAEQLSQTAVQGEDGAQRNIRAQSVGSHQTTEENRAALAAFDAGELDVLTFVNSLEQSWDSERPRFMINGSPTTSIVKSTQLLGRLLRGNEEVVYLDFMDRSKKGQTTSLHVLGEDRVDYARSVGGGSGSREQRTLQIGSILSSDLFNSIQVSEGKLLTDLSFTEVESQEAALHRKWERILADEGMPEELPNIFPVPDFAVQALALARQVLGDNTSVERLTEHIYEQNLTHLKQYDSVANHVRAAYADEQVENIDDYEITSSLDPTADIVSLRGLANTLDIILNDLSEREEGTIRMRFGLEDDHPRTLDEIADVFNVTRERIRQVESKTMAKLRHPSRSSFLRSYINDGYKEEAVSKSSPLYGLPFRAYVGKSVEDFIGDKYTATRFAPTSVLHYLRNVFQDGRAVVPHVTTHDVILNREVRLVGTSAGHIERMSVRLRHEQSRLSRLRKQIHQTKYPEPRDVEDAVRLHGFVTSLSEIIKTATVAPS